MHRCKLQTSPRWKYVSFSLPDRRSPKTRSLAASTPARAQWLIGDGLLPDNYTASQGLNIGRAGQVYVRRDTDGQVWIGGDSVTCIKGEVLL